ncbi:hypothetical protein WUBG_15938, partial [Wuchereria bancrofti]
MVGSNHFIVATKDKPLLHFLSMDNSKRLHVRSVLPKPVHHLAVTPDGSLLFAAISNEIYVWIIVTGELIAVINGHYRSISSLLLNSDGSLLAFGTEDGSLGVFVVAELVSENPAFERTLPFRQWRPHSLSVSDIAVTRHSNARILSCSKDHTAALHSVTANICLLKVGSVEMVGSNHFIVATKDKPLLHFLSMDNSKRLHVRSVLPKPVHHLAVTPDGSLLFAAISNEIYVWI